MFFQGLGMHYNHEILSCILKFEYPINETCIDPLPFSCIFFDAILR